MGDAILNRLIGLVNKIHKINLLQDNFQFHDLSFLSMTPQNGPHRRKRAIDMIS